MLQKILIMVLFVSVTVSTTIPYKRADAFAGIIPAGIEAAYAAWTATVAAVSFLGGGFDKSALSPESLAIAGTIWEMSTQGPNAINQALSNTLNADVTSAAAAGSLVMSVDTSIQSWIGSHAGAILTPTLYKNISKTSNIPLSYCTGNGTNPNAYTMCILNSNVYDHRYNSLYWQGYTTDAVYYYHSDGRVQFGYQPLEGRPITNIVVGYVPLTNSLRDMSAENRLRYMLGQFDFTVADVAVHSLTAAGVNSLSNFGTAFPAGKIVAPAMTQMQPVIAGTGALGGQPLTYNWSNGSYADAAGQPFTGAVKWVPPAPVVQQSTGNIGVSIPIAGQDVFVPATDVTNTHNPYVNNPQIPAQLEDYVVNLPLNIPQDVYMLGDTPYLDLPIIYTPSNVALPALTFEVDPPIAGVDPVTGRVTPWSPGDAIITVRPINPAIPTVTGIPITIHPGAPVNPGPRDDWPDRLGQAVTTRFPFSLPWDLYGLLSVLSAPPLKPVIDVDVPLMGKANQRFKFSHDFGYLDPYMPFFRAFAVIGFTIFLALQTRNLLGGSK